METFQANIDAASLGSVIATELLEKREARLPNPPFETHAHLDLAHELAASPAEFFSKLVRAALDLCNAGSAGISLLLEDEDRFVWPAIAGALNPYVGGGTPRGFGPCGTVLDRNCPQLFVRPERHFTYLSAITPLLEEVLIVPFYVSGKAVGTVWSVLHVGGRGFDAEDKNLLERLGAFAASAYRVFADLGMHQPFLGSRHNQA